MEKKLLLPSANKSGTIKAQTTSDPKNTSGQLSQTTKKDSKASTTTRKPIDVKTDKLASKSKPSEEILAEVQIFPIERQHLDRVFNLLSNASPKSYAKDEKPYISLEDITAILEKLDFKMHRSEIELMIWEVDENLDDRVDKEEFDLMYKRCIKDDTGLEPKNLFNLVQFLMFDRRGKWKITEEDTYDLIYVREVSLDALDAAIKIIFGEEERRLDGQEREITFAEFIERRNKKALELEKEREKAKKMQKSTLIKDEK